MTNKILSCAALTALVTFAGLKAQGPARTSPTQPGGLPMFEPDPTWPKVPAKWKLGDVSSVGIDAQDRIWVLQRPRTLPANEASMAAPPVLVFDAAGNFVQAWGGPGNGFEWPQREHGIYVDYKGFVWIGGNYCPARALPGLKAVEDDQLLKFTQDGAFVMQIGHSSEGTGNADKMNMRQPADAFVYKKTNELFVADGYGNHRVVVFDADTGEFRRMWGAFGNAPEDLYNCPAPSSTSVPDGQGPQQFGVVHAIRVSNDGLVYVADRENRRVQVFTTDGKYVNQILEADIPFARDLTLSTDPQQRFLYVGADTILAVVDRKALKILELIKGEGILGGGHEMIADSKGNLYTAHPSRGLQKLAFKGLSSPSR